MKLFKTHFIFAILLIVFSKASYAIYVDFVNVENVQTTAGQDFFNINDPSDIFGWFEIDDTAYANQQIFNLTTDIVDYRIQIGDYLLSSENQNTDTVINNTLYFGNSDPIFGDTFTIILDKIAILDPLSNGTTSLIQVREVNGDGDRVIFQTDWQVHPSGQPLNPSIDSETIPEPSILALFGLGLAGIGFARRKKY